MAPKAGTKSKSGETITEPQNGKSKSEKQVGEPAASQNGTPHPPYIVMAKAAISEMNEKGGSSRQAILKFVTSKYSLGSTANRNLNNALKKLLDDKEIVRSKLTTKGANGSFKLAGGKINSKPKEDSKKGDHKKEGTGVEPTSEPKSKKAKTSGSKVRMEKLVESSSASSAESESDAPVVKKAPKLSQVSGYSKLVSNLQKWLWWIMVIPISCNAIKGIKGQI